MEEKTEFDDIYRLYYSRLYCYALQIVHDSEECHDIVTAAYEQVWRYFDTIERTTVQAYLYTFVRNKCIDYLRHRETHEQYVAACRHAEQYDMLEKAMMDEERMRMIKKAMERLTPRTRFVLEACFIERKKYKEVAVELGVSVNAVKKHIVKALHILREEKEKCC